MHMADALVSPSVGSAFWAVSAGTIALCSAQVRRELDDRKVPLMGVLAAFVFAAQMINFTIPATGSSGHLGGGLLLAILLGPAAAFLSIASVLMVQALFFADGGLLALGCNMFNLGIVPSFVAYPLIYKKMVGTSPSHARIVFTSIVAAVVALQVGSLGVVLQTLMSGVSSLPFSAFVVLMQPIHLAIGIVEGVATALIVSFVYRARPELLDCAWQGKPLGNMPIRSLLATFLIATFLTGGFLAWFASEHPDGLEWSIAQVTSSQEPVKRDPLSGPLEDFQEKTALFPDYALRENPETNSSSRLGTSLAGLVGGALTLFVCILAGFLLRKWKKR